MLQVLSDFLIFHKLLIAIAICFNTVQICRASWTL